MSEKATWNCWLRFENTIAAWHLLFLKKRESEVVCREWWRCTWVRLRLFLPIDTSFFLIQFIFSITFSIKIWRVWKITAIPSRHQNTSFSFELRNRSKRLVKDGIWFSLSVSVGKKDPLIFSYSRFLSVYLLST